MASPDSKTQEQFTVEILHEGIRVMDRTFDKPEEAFIPKAGLQVQFSKRHQPGRGGRGPFYGIRITDKNNPSILFLLEHRDISKAGEIFRRLDESKIVELGRLERKFLNDYAGHQENAPRQRLYLILALAVLVGYWAYAPIRRFVRSLMEKDEKP